MSTHADGFKTPSPYWYLPTVFVGMLCATMLATTQIEIFTELMCYRAGVEPASPLTTLGGDGEWSALCRKTPEVQRLVTELISTIYVITGVLGTVLTGYWGALSERVGRKPVLIMACVGNLLHYAVILAVIRFRNTIDWRFIYLSAIVEGLAGSNTTIMATVTSFISDCTPAGSRSAIFSFSAGCLFCGITVGPAFGALLIRFSGSILVPFYVSLAIQAVFCIAIVFFPESRSPEERRLSTEKHNEQVSKLVSNDLARSENAGALRIALVRTRRAGVSLLMFLQPIALYFPRKVGYVSLDASPAYRWNFELFKLALSFMINAIAIGAVQFKLMYVSYKFGWGPQESGYFLSVVGALRVIILLGILPVLIRLVRPAPPVPERPRPSHTASGVTIFYDDDEEEEGVTPGDSDATAVASAHSPPKALSRPKSTTSLTSTATDDSYTPPNVPLESTVVGRPIELLQSIWDEEAKALRIDHDMKFDLALYAFANIAQMAGYFVLGANGGHKTIFYFGIVVQAMGSSSLPAAQSLALHLGRHRDTGKLFAGLMSLESLCAQVIGPVVMGAVYFMSVNTLPEAFFLVCGGLFVISVLIILFISPTKNDGEIMAEPNSVSECL